MCRRNKYKTYFIFILACLLIFGCSKGESNVSSNAASPPVSDEKAETQADANEVKASQEKNIASIRAVLETELTVPNESYLQVQQNLSNKYDEIYATDSEETVYTADPTEGTPEREAYTEFLKQTYEPYFTENGFDFYTSAFALTFHHLGGHPEPDYEIRIQNLKVEKSNNPRAPLVYNFTVLIDYIPKKGEPKQFTMTGNAICPEEGKIGELNFRDDGGLQQYIMDSQL
ncbi:hypothetical protein P6709_10085 [Jeotgalibacillus sp. ET6]|uniref:hypothetical protein n=1 Tax=Jeotgalibacillus sp. ET6 TaxID=3037260 RepID=UPI002418B156|nr:hypothetical protein [Jeotgalibacillus sp. ET6]MDG5472101.1 hypothetical protein [Jeotgalibacillus sp. ET6]